MNGVHTYSPPANAVTPIAHINMSVVSNSAGAGNQVRDYPTDLMNGVHTWSPSNTAVGGAVTTGRTASTVKTGGSSQTDLLKNVRSADGTADNVGKGLSWSDFKHFVSGQTKYNATNSNSTSDLGRDNSSVADEGDAFGSGSLAGVYPTGSTSGVTTTTNLSIAVIGTQVGAAVTTRSSNNDRIATPGTTKGGYLKPVILDLDGDGIEITPLGSSNTFFDVVGGKQHRTAWAGAGDGVLVFDVNDEDDARPLGYLRPARVREGRRTAPQRPVCPCLRPDDRGGPNRRPYSCAAHKS